MCLLRLIKLFLIIMLGTPTSRNATAPNGDDCVPHTVMNMPHIAAPNAVPRFAAVRNNPLAKSGASVADVDTMN